MINQIKFFEGTNYRVGVQVNGITDVTRLEVWFRQNSGSVLKVFSTEDDSIEVDDNNYSFGFLAQDTHANFGRGTWQIVLYSTLRGIVKSDTYSYTIAQAVATTSTGPDADTVNHAINWTFEEDTQTVST
jgi:hypothetical protein